MIERRLFYGEDYDYFGEFLLDKNVKSYWVALFSLCLYWGFFWFFRHLFGANESRDEAAGHRLEANRRVVSPTVKSINARLNRSCDAIRDSVLMLLVALVFNTMARGGKHSIMVLAWIYFGMTVFWSLSEMIYEHHIAKLIYSIVAYGIIITIGGVAYQNGFDTYD